MKRIVLKNQHGLRLLTDFDETVEPNVEFKVHNFNRTEKMNETGTFIVQIPTDQFETLIRMYLDTRNTKPK